MYTKDMKKMYNNPTTEAVEFFSSNLMLEASIQEGEPGAVDAPARGTVIE